MSRFDLSVIIVNWNTRQLLADCLKSIETTLQVLTVEVIIVDNGSTDGSQVMLGEQFPYVRLIQNQTNEGFARANNQAFAICQGRYVLLLNSDTVILPNALETMIRFADAQSDAGIIGCKLLNGDGSLQESWAKFPTLWSELWGQNVRIRRLVEEKSLSYEVDWVGGACLLVRPAAIQQVGGLDEGYFMYSEETDWCFRMKRQGWKVYYLASAEIIHLGGGSASRASLAQLVRLYESKIRFFHKHYGARSANLLRYSLVIANTLGLMRRLLLWPLRRTHWNEIHKRLEIHWQLMRYLLRPQLVAGGQDMVVS